MKARQREDVWRHVGPGRTDPRGIRSLSLSGLSGFADSVIELCGATVFCGTNSSGKTRLMAKLHEAAHQLLEGSIRTDIEIGLEDLPYKSIEFIDSFWLLQKQRVSIGMDVILNERIEQAGLSAMPDQNKAVLQYLLGRDYDSVAIAELDATDDFGAIEHLLADPGTVRAAMSFRDDVVPYFEVVRHGTIFRSSDLSQGELAGLTLVWALSQLTPDTLVFVEEPESFLSPISAQRALDVVAYFADRRRSQCIVTSHSHLGLIRIPAHNIFVLTQNAKDVASLVPANPYNLWKALKLRPPHAIIFVVEDKAASEWLHQLLRLVDFAHVDVSAVWIGGDASNVRVAASFPDCQEADVAIWGVLDGDERHLPVNKKLRNVMYLPGDTHPEGSVELALRLCSAEQIGVDPTQLQNAIATHEGMNSHDKLTLIAHDLGLTVSHFRGICLRAWVHHTEPGKVALANFEAELARVEIPGAEVSS